MSKKHDIDYTLWYIIDTRAAMNTKDDLRTFFQKAKGIPQDKVILCRVT